MRLDGDALGSELALYLMLKDLGKEAVIYNQIQRLITTGFCRPLPILFTNWMILKPMMSVLFLIVPSSTVWEKYQGEVVKIKTLINIDHHVSNGGCTIGGFLIQKPALRENSLPFDGVKCA